jgi:hypothetical protein
MDKETENLLLEASHEIKSLRKANSEMAARLDVFDKIMLLFESSPAYSARGMSEDLVYKIEKHIQASINF